MMRQMKRVIALLLVIISVIALLPVSALAANYKVETLKFNKWYKLHDSSMDMTIYKVRITTDTAIMINWRNYDKSHFGYGEICSDRDCQNNMEVFLGSGIDSSGYEGIVLYKGTYYIRMYHTQAAGQVKFSSKPASKVNKQNYCMGKAIQLSANKKVEFAQSKKDNYTRWYRIKLPTSRYITMYGYDGNYDLYDCNFNEIRCSRDYDKNTITTDGMQNAGTYYLALSSYISSLLKTGKYYRIYWN